MQAEKINTQFKDLAARLQAMSAESLATPPALNPDPTPTVNNIELASKLLPNQSGINPLVATAAPLFAIHNRLKTLTELPNLTILFDELCREINAFEQQLQKQDYRAQLLLAARYVLCALLDEAILNTAWSATNSWSQYTLLQALHQENDDGEKLFLILARCHENPTECIDLIELIYLCLSLGFCGKYRQLPQGQQQLAEIIDQLYEIICQHRGESTKMLFAQPVPVVHKTKLNLLSPWLMISSACILALGIYSSLNYSLTAATTPVYQLLQKINLINHSEAQ